MDKSDTHIFHSMNIAPAERETADEVAAGNRIDIDVRQPKREAGESHVSVGVYCKTQSDAVRFERALMQRRWENSKVPGEE